MTPDPGAYARAKAAERAAARDAEREAALRADPAHMRLCHHAEHMRRCAGCSWDEVARALRVTRAEAREMAARAVGRSLFHGNNSS